MDDCRAQARVDGRVCVRSRPGRDCTEQFPELAELAGGGRRLVLDGSSRRSDARCGRPAGLSKDGPASTECGSA
jgi:ATP-dependent DNA ligase